MVSFREVNSTVNAPKAIGSQYLRRVKCLATNRPRTLSHVNGRLSQAFGKDKKKEKKRVDHGGDYPGSRKAFQALYENHVSIIGNMFGPP